MPVAGSIEAAGWHVGVDAVHLPNMPLTLHCHSDLASYAPIIDLIPPSMVTSEPVMYEPCMHSHTTNSATSCASPGRRNGILNAASAAREVSASVGLASSASAAVATSVVPQVGPASVLTLCSTAPAGASAWPSAVSTCPEALADPASFVADSLLLGTAGVPSSADVQLAAVAVVLLIFAPSLASLLTTTPMPAAAPFSWMGVLMKPNAG